MLKKTLKALVPPVVLQAIWAWRTYDTWFAKRLLRDRFEQPRCKRLYDRLNANLPPNEQILPPDVRMQIIPELRPAYELYAYGDMRNVVEMRGFLRYAKGFKCLVDIGALYGDFSLVFCALTGGSAHAVDPSPEANAVLAKLIAANPAVRIHPHSLALGAEPGTLEMAYEWIHCVALAGAKSESRTVSVTQQTMDRFVADLPETPDVMKIDAEGAELDILKGGRDYFTRHRPRIFMEVHPTYLQRRNQSVAELVALLSEYGYTLYHSDGVPVRDPARVLSKDEGFLVHRVICDAGKPCGRLAR